MRKLLLARAVCTALFFHLSVFAISAEVTDRIEKARVLLCKKTDRISAAFFSPAKEVKEVILGLIANEQESIRIAAYRLTEPDVAKALADAVARGVRVSIVTDYSNFSDKKEKVSELFHAGALTRYYARPFSIMHDKIFLFAKNFFGGPVLVTGSANLTKSGYASNLENIVVMNERSLIKKFAKHLLHLETLTLEGIPGVIKQMYEKQSLYGALPKTIGGTVAKAASMMMKNR